MSCREYFHLQNFETERPLRNICELYNDNGGGVVFLIAGCFMDATSAVLIFNPLFLPIALSLGIAPIHFDAVMVFNLLIEPVTPPVGINLFVDRGIANVDLKEI